MTDVLLVIAGSFAVVFGLYYGGRAYVRWGRRHLS